MKITELIGRPVRRRRARRRADAIRAKLTAARRQVADTDALLARRGGGAR
jgi:hypothetical protein